MTLLVTGGAGFIGGNFVLDWIAGSDEPVVNLDKLTYAGNLETLASLQGHPRHTFVQGDIGDRTLVERLLAEHRPRAIIHFAAESHVDRSIHGPGDFIQTNIVGTFNLLESVRGYWSALPEADIREQGLAPTGAGDSVGGRPRGRTDREQGLAPTGAGDSVGGRPCGRTDREQGLAPTGAVDSVGGRPRGRTDREQGLAPAKSSFRFLHVSTDEVYGTLSPTDPAFAETNRYEPNSPYSASKAASDHLVRAWHHTYGLPVLTTNCSNNYGPYHFPEKLIPLMIVNALAGKNLPVYGDGMQIRDWLYVKDHCSAIRRVLEAGRLGETYNVGGWNEKPNIEIVKTVCALLDELRPKADGTSYATQISYVTDRPGHDRRYAIDARKLEAELGWRPAETFETGIRKTVQWYLEHPQWVANVQSGAYREWVSQQYAP